MTREESKRILAEFRAESGMPSEPEPQPAGIPVEPGSVELPSPESLARASTMREAAADVERFRPPKSWSEVPSIALRHPEARPTPVTPRADETPEETTRRAGAVGEAMRASRAPVETGREMLAPSDATWTGTVGHGLSSFARAVPSTMVLGAKALGAIGTGAGEVLREARLAARRAAPGTGRGVGGKAPEEGRPTPIPPSRADDLEAMGEGAGRAALGLTQATLGPLGLQLTSEGDTPRLHFDPSRAGEFWSRAPLESAVLTAGLVAPVAAGAARGLRVGRIAGTEGLGRALTGSWAKGKTGGQIADVMATPKRGTPGFLPKAERFTRAVQEGAGKVAEAPLRAAASAVLPTSSVSYQAGLARMAAGVPGEGIIGETLARMSPPALRRRAVMSPAVQALLKPSEFGAAFSRAFPTQGEALAAKEAVGAETMGVVGDALREILSKPPEIRDASMRAFEALPESVQRGFVAEARQAGTGEGREFVRRNVLKEGYLDRPPPKTLEQETGHRVVFRELDKTGKPTGQQWYRQQDIPNEVFERPSLTGRQNLQIDYERIRLPEVAEPKPAGLLPPSDPFGKPGLPALQTEGIGVSRFAPTVMREGDVAGAMGRAAESALVESIPAPGLLPPPLPQAGRGPFKAGPTPPAPVVTAAGAFPPYAGSIEVPRPSAIPLPKQPPIGAGTLLPPGALPPPRAPIPVMPPPGFSAAEKAMAQATGEAVPPGPPTLKPPPPPMRGDEFTARTAPPIRAVSLPEAVRVGPRGDITTPPVQTTKPGAMPSLGQRIAEDIVPEVPLPGAPEMPFLKPGMEVQTRIRGVEGPVETAMREARAAANLNLERQHRELLVEERAAKQAEYDAAADLFGPSAERQGQIRNALDQLGMEGERRGIWKARERVGAYSLTRHDMQKLSRENPALYAKVAKATREAIESGEGPDHAVRRVWADAPPEMRRKVFAEVLSPEQRVIETARDLADHIGRDRALDVLKTTSLDDAAYEAMTASNPKAGKGWVRMVTPRGKSSKYGALEGRWVPKETRTAVDFMDGWIKPREWSGSDLMQLWKISKLAPPLSIGTSVRNNLSFLLSQSVMGRVGLLAGEGRQALFDVLDQMSRDKIGPDVAEAMAWGGGSSAITAPGVRIPQPVYKSLKAVYKEAFSTPFNPNKWLRAVTEAEVESARAAGIEEKFARRGATKAPEPGSPARGRRERGSLTRLMAESPAVEAMGEAYGIQDRVQGFALFTLFRGHQRRFQAGGSDALRLMQDYEARLGGPDMALRFLRGSGREAMSLAELVKLNYSDLNPASAWWARNVAPFSSFRFADADLVRFWLSHNPQQAAVLRLGDEMGTRLAYETVFRNPEIAPDQMAVLRGALADGMPLGEVTGDDGQPQIVVLPVAGMMAQAQLFPTMPQREAFVPTGPVLGPLAQQVMEHPALQLGLSVPVLAGAERVSRSTGPPVLGLNLPTPGPEEIKALSPARKAAVAAQDVAGVVLFPAAYHGLKGWQALTGQENPYTGKVPEWWESPMAFAGLGKPVTIDLPSAQRAFKGAKAGAVRALETEGTKLKRRGLTPEERDAMDEIKEQLRKAKAAKPR